MKGSKGADQIGKGPKGEASKGSKGADQSGKGVPSKGSKNADQSGKGVASKGSKDTDQSGKGVASKGSKDTDQSGKGPQGASKGSKGADQSSKGTKGAKGAPVGNKDIIVDHNGKRKGERTDQLDRNVCRRVSFGSGPAMHTITCHASSLYLYIYTCAHAYMHAVSEATPSPTSTEPATPGKWLGIKLDIDCYRIHVNPTMYIEPIRPVALNLLTGLSFDPTRASLP